ncbi:MAG: tellurium resistance protein TerC [Phenylobacterium sp. RIFCSPHIGHO2_01_FULL_69_31]|jgi:YjbE family integral membrane protein|uniref:TerC family protein n=1 Tax=Phenylobacterium sp. RIFCSPHIGHO2_01_FULL_69_31 TaxID=1801944 RepID=UPI0008B6EDCB|nr:TerC family protein [Phenylobacterium sp. RIFCSPHIGHO2_01_FULL_69_31]OHB27033.1 MAG: tellurium resistance protein TerC [Phenylobacterium sp. RIFCSPHIGHO2_01_FULL_69_31]
MFEELFSPGALSALLQVLMIDLVLAGDNAVAVGLAAGGLPPEQRRKAIFWGLVAAVVTRIGFALITTQLLGIVGLLFAGGLLLLWVCWKMWRELRDQASAEEVAAEAAMDDDPSTEPKVKPKTFKDALIQILIADVSMSLDNVLAVAGAAREHPTILVFGLILSIALMGVAAHGIARLLHKYRWIGFVGLAIVLYVALHMMWQGHQDVVADLGYTAEYNEVMPDVLDIKPKAPAPAH